jgi:hypothetical protein
MVGAAPATASPQTPLAARAPVPVKTALAMPLMASRRAPTMAPLAPSLAYL